MITTISIKEKLREVFEIGNGNTNILVLGSCRCVAYINYLNRYNQMSGEPFTIFAIEPNNYHWDEHENPVNLQEELLKLETDKRILSIILSTEIFIHEHYSHFYMFNTDRNASKNIYQFGMEPRLDITIPNFHDRFVLEKDYEACGIPLPDDYIQRGEEAMEGFCAVTEKSSFPVFAKVFRDTWRDIRYFWRPNHISANFSVGIFVMMNRDFLELPLSEEFWEEARKEDLFKEPHTAVTQRDIEGYHLTWS